MSRGTRVTAALLAALAGCLAPAASVGAAVPRGASLVGELTGVSCASAGACWAVGETGLNVAFAEHWNGSAWSVVPLPAPRGAGLTQQPAISCPAVTSCWAVGDYQSVKTSMYLPYAEHWNGTAWSVVLMPHPAGSFFTTPVAVSCASVVNCWAAGTTTGRVTPLLERWNGRAWSLVQAPAIGARSNLLGVFCASAADCWATGYGKGGALAAHWDGRAWSVTPTPASAGELLSTGCSGADCVSVGYSGLTTLGEHWNGSAWQVTPTGKVQAHLLGVSCAAGFRCVAVGNTLRGRAFSEVWNGSAWRIVSPQVPVGSAAAGLAGVSCVTATDCWSVGNRFNEPQGATALIERWNGTAWSIVP